MYGRTTRHKVVKVIPAIFCLSTAIVVMIWYQNTVKHLGATGEKIVINTIAAEYQRYHLSRADLSIVEKAKLLSDIQKMKIRSLTARGESENLVVRIEVEPNTIQPPGLPTVQYYQLKYSSLSGWANKGRTTAENYYFSDLNRLYN
jgi:hypothetical protein